MPDAASIGKITPFAVHPLGGSIACVEADPKGYRRAELLGGVFSRAQQLAANPPAAVFLKDVKIRKFRYAPVGERPFFRLGTQKDVSRQRTAVYGGKGQNLPAVLLQKIGSIDRQIRMIPLG